MSKRQELMIEISDFVNENGLAGVYSGFGLSSDKKFRYVLLSKPRILDGEIRIYGPKFLMLRYQTAIRDLPHEDRRVFTSVENLYQFLKYAFIDHKHDEALEVPTK